MIMKSKHKIKKKNIRCSTGIASINQANACTAVAGQRGVAHPMITVKMAVSMMDKT